MVNDLISNAGGEIALDPNKRGCDFYGATIQPPEVLRDGAVSSDALLLPLCGGVSEYPALPLADT